MKTFPKNKFVKIEPRLRLRKEEHCVLVIDTLSGRFYEATPSQAVIITLFDGNATISKVTDLVSEIYSDTFENSHNVVLETLTQLEDNRWVEFHDTPGIVMQSYETSEFMFNPVIKEGINVYKSPITMEFMLTKGCNFECVYCYMSAKNSHELNKQTMSYQTFSKIVEQAKEMEVKRAFLAGGEPLLSKDIIKMVQLLISCDIFPYISTNGSLLTRELIDELYSSGLRFIQLSFDSSNPITFDTLTGKQNSFKGVMKNLILLKNKGMQVRIKSVVTKHNWKDIGKLIDFCCELEIFDLEIVPSLPSADGRDNFSDIELNKIELLELREIIQKKRIEKSNFNFGYRDPLLIWPSPKPVNVCGGGMTSLVIMPDGQASICDMMSEKKFSLGNLHKFTLNDVWNSKGVNSLRNLSSDLLHEECKNCKHLGLCRTGCFNLSKMTYGDYFAPDPRCPVRINQNKVI
ncbi:radical SAM/SPASM domain-containing protein [Paenibacillus sp. FSL R7-0179]|uniref:radical SAM/SPASM domain-containing protein n=1 Tax=Paenibacillus sp. FSL R7-0179 TaxID=2921672 RepID=UPI0030FA7220